MGSGGDIPGVVGQGAREQTVFVIEKMGGDRVDNLLGEFGGGRRLCRERVSRITSGTRSPDPGYSFVPNSSGK